MYAYRIVPCRVGHRLAHTAGVAHAACRPPLRQALVVTGTVRRAGGVFDAVGRDPLVRKQVVAPRAGPHSPCRAVQQGLKERGAAEGREGENYVRGGGEMRYIGRLVSSPNADPMPTLRVTDIYTLRRHAAYSTQHTAHSTQHTAHSTQYTVHSTQHTAHSTQHTAHSTVRTNLRREIDVRPDTAGTDVRDLETVRER